MTDSDEAWDNPELMRYILGRHRVIQGQKKDAFALHLVRCGVKLVDNSERLSGEELVEFYLSRPLPFFEELTDDECVEYALSAYARSKDLDVEIARVWAVIEGFAHLQAMAEVNWERDGSEPGDRVGMLLSTRSHMIGYLASSGCWCPPFIEYVDREMPGPDPTEEELAQYQTNADDQNRIIQQAREETVEEFEMFFAEQGYALQAEDRLCFLLLFKLLYLASHYPPDAPDQIGIETSFREIITHASQPDHKAWELFTDKYFG